MPAESMHRPLLAGVCGRLAGALGWNVWGIRGAWLLLLVFKPLIAMALYLLLAVVFGSLEDRPRRHASRPALLTSPELAARARRIETLDRRLASSQ